MRIRSAALLCQSAPSRLAWPPAHIALIRQRGIRECNDSAHAISGGISNVHCERDKNVMCPAWRGRRGARRVGINIISRPMSIDDSHYRGIISMSGNRRGIINELAAIAVDNAYIIAASK